MDNSIVKPLTPDGMCGWDGFGQLWVYHVTKEGRLGRLIGDPRGHKCRICGQGWVLTTESLMDQHWIREYQEWRHLSCHVRFLGLCDRDMWVNLLVDTRLWFTSIQEIPNEYWRNDPPYSDRPWYRVTLRDCRPTLKLGRRKRVYHMEIEPHDKKPLPIEQAQELFRGENVTKGVSDSGIYIHAWTEAKALEYLKAFEKMLSPKPQIAERNA